MTERRISIHTNQEGRAVGISIDPSLHTESALEEIATRTLQHGANQEEILLFRRSSGLTHVTHEDLLDLRLMFRLGDNPQLIIDRVTEELKSSRRATKKTIKTPTF